MQEVIAINSEVGYTRVWMLKGDPDVDDPFEEKIDHKVKQNPLYRSMTELTHFIPVPPN